MTTLVETWNAAVRSIKRSPRFALAVVATLALGIAPNCVIFAIMDATYFRPLPYPAQERLVLLDVVSQRGSTPEPPDDYVFAECRSRSRSFEQLAAYRGAGIDVTVDGRPERLGGQAVTGRFFDLLGARPALGRTITDADCAPGAAPVLVVSHRAWQEVFNGRPDIVNLAVRIDGAPGAVVGVMPASFTSFMEGRTARAWVPAAATASSAPGVPGGRVIGRLRPGVTREQAQADVKTIQAALAASFPAALGDCTVVLREFRSALFGGLGPGIKMLAVIVGLLLVIACANAANLLLGRAAERERDLALRAALGAPRSRLAAGPLAESLLLAGAAAAVGLLLAAWGTRLVWSGAAPLFVRIGVDGFPFDARVVLFAVGLTATAATIFGVGPALRGSRTELGVALKAGLPSSGRSRRAGRTTRALVVGQVALCVITLLVTALMLQSFLHFSSLSSRPGFDAAGLFAATVPAPAGERAEPIRRVALLAEIERSLRAEPGIDLVAVTSRLPFLENGTPVAVARAGAATAQAKEADAEARTVNRAYFAAFSVPVVKGRLFTDQDSANQAPVVVVDERLAAAVWGAADPVGESLLVEGTPRTVVGVVASPIRPSPFRPSTKELFLPYGQAAPGELKFVVRSRLSSAAAAAAVRRRVAALDPDLPVVALQPVTEALDDFMTPFRLILGLISVFGAVALSLAALGLYSILSRDVARRSHEIGVRMAMGADRRAIVAMAIRQGLRPAVTGLAIGLVLGAAMTRILPSELLGVRGLAPWHYPAAVLLWLAVAVAACAVPARRAAAVDPLTALRCD
jgi:putative ABC transport system permease protein